MRHHIQRSLARTATSVTAFISTILIAAMVVVVFAPPANAQDNLEERGVDVAAVVERAEQYVSRVVDVDFDPDGFADYDSEYVSIAASGLSLIGVLGLFFNARPAQALQKKEEV